MRTLVPGLLDKITASGQTPGYSVTLSDVITRYTSLSNAGTPGRSHAILSASGSLLIAITTQTGAFGTDPQTVSVRNIPAPATASGAQWQAAASTVTTTATYRAGACLIQSAGTTRCFYQRASDQKIAYKDSTDDGVTWGAETLVNVANPFGLNNFCHGIAADSLTSLHASYATYDIAANDLRYSSFTAGAWTAWTSVGPLTPTWGSMRGLEVTTVAGLRVYTCGVQMNSQLTGYASAFFTWDGAATYSAMTQVQPQDNPNYGIAANYPGLSYDGAAYLMAVHLTDDGSFDGTVQSRAHIFRSTNLTTWTPLASLGDVFQFGFHDMTIAGVSLLFDASVCYRAGTPPAPLDATPDVLSINVVDRINEPSTAAVVLSNTTGAYTAIPQLRADAHVALSLGYDNTLQPTHLFVIESIESQATLETNTVTLQMRDCTKLLDYASTRFLSYNAYTIAQLIAVLASHANLPVAPLPTTDQFSQTIPCFQILSGETWLTALKRLSSVYGFIFWTDHTPQLRVAERQSTDTPTWSYSTETLSAAWATISDQANIIRVVGADSLGNAVFADVIDGPNLITTGQARYRQLLDRELDTPAKCKIRATILLHDERADSTAGALEIAPNPGHELADVILITDTTLDLSNQPARIFEQVWHADPETVTFSHTIHLQGT